MTPEHDLGRLLAAIDPERHDGVFALCSFGAGEVPAGLTVSMLFRESEGDTVLVPWSEAEAEGGPGGAAVPFACEWITLGANSDLAAVGFLATVTTALAGAGISANAISAYYHDHLLVRAGQGEQAMEVLRRLQREAGAH